MKVLNIPVSERPHPNTIPGPCFLGEGYELSYQASNRMSWGTNNLLAYACQKLVVVIDPTSVQRLTVLTGHKYPVCCVKWSEYMTQNGMESREGHAKVLVSGDSRGYLFIWDVLKGKKIYMFLEEHARGVMQIEFLRGNLLVLSKGGSVSLYSLIQKKKNWRIETNDPQVFTLSLDPFEKETITLCSNSGWIYTVNNLTLQSVQIPANNPNQQTANLVKKKFKLSSKSSQEKGKGRNILKEFMFSKTVSNQLFLVTEHEVSIFDLRIDKTLACRKMTYLKSPFIKIFQTEYNKDRIISLHQDSSIIVWDWNEEAKKWEFYRLESPSRYGKISKSRKGILMGMAVSSFGKDFDKLACFDTNGKVWIWKYEQVIKRKPRFLLTGFIESVNSNFRCSSFCTGKKSIAIGTVYGDILIFDLLTFSLKSKFSLFPGVEVKGIAWFNENNLVAISGKKSINGVYNNECHLLNVLDGSSKLIRKVDVNIEYNIIGVKVSFSGRYMVLVIKDRPLEVWSLVTNQLLKLIKIKNVLALEWSANFFKTKEKKKIEQFIISKQGGNLQFYYVESNKKINEIKEKRLPTFSSISAICVKGKYFVCGDIDGNIIIWNQSKENKSISTHKGSIKKLSLCQSGQHLLVKFSDGTFGIWDMKNLRKISFSSKGTKSSYVEWTTNNMILSADSQKHLILYDITLTSGNSSFLKRSCKWLMKSPVLLPQTQLLFLKHTCLNGTLGDKERERRRMVMVSDTVQEEDKTPNGGKSIILRNCYGETVTKEVNREGVVSFKMEETIHEGLLEENIKKKLENSKVIETCLLTSEIFDDIIGKEFWNMVSSYLPLFKKISVEKKKKHNSSNYEVVTPKKFYSPTKNKKEGEKKEEKKYNGLNGLFRESKAIKKEENFRVDSFNETVRNNGITDLYKTVASHSSLLGRVDDSVNLLVETPAYHPEMITNFLHACVISASNSISHFKQTVLLVSSNLFSHGTLNEKYKTKYILLGAELLCLIGEGLRACKFLQNFEFWSEATRIAKCVLNKEEREIVLTRWARNLMDRGRVLEAIKVFLSLGCFYNVVSLLHEKKMDDIAYHFILACNEAKVPILKSAQPKGSNIFIATEKVEKNVKKELFEEIKKNYENFLLNLGMKVSNELEIMEEKEETGEKEEIENITDLKKEEIITWAIVENESI